MDSSREVFFTELYLKYGDNADKLLVMQSSKVTYCIGVYKEGNFIAGALGILNDGEWEILEGAKAQKTAEHFFCYFDSLCDTVDEHIENANSGFDMDKFFTNLGGTVHENNQ